MTFRDWFIGICGIAGVAAASMYYSEPIKIEAIIIVLLLAILFAMNRDDKL